MFRRILILVTLVHLPMHSAEQEVPRPDTPSEPQHIVTLHKRSSSHRTASFSVASTIVSQISSSRRNSASSISTLELSDNTPSPSTVRIPIKTDSPRHAIPIQVSPKSQNSVSSDAASQFPYGYRVDGNVPIIAIDDDVTISPTCGSCCGASCLVAGIFTGLVFGVVAIINKYGSGS